MANVENYGIVKNRISAFLLGVTWFCIGCRIFKLRLSADDDVGGQLWEARHVILPRVRLGVGSQSGDGDDDGTTGGLTAGTEHTNITDWSLSVTARRLVDVGRKKCVVTARPYIWFWYVLVLEYDLDIACVPVCLCVTLVDRTVIA